MSKSSMRSQKRMFHDVQRVRGELLSELCKPSLVFATSHGLFIAKFHGTIERADFFLRIVLLQVGFILGSAQVKVQKKFNLCILFAQLLMRFSCCENMAIV